jgi:glycosyltransferase involved in cell wall biosynthesis
MRILFATEYYPPFAPGGSPWSIQLLAEALCGRGHAVTVVTPGWGGADRREGAAGPRVVRFPVRRRLPPGATLAPTRSLVGPWFHLSLCRALVDEARRHGADVIHAQDKHALVGSYLAARRLGRPVFLTLRDVGLICPITTCLLSNEFVPDDCSALKLQRECAAFYLDHYIGQGALRRARVRLNLALLYADAQLKNLVLRRLDGLISVSAGLLEIYLRSGHGRRERAYVVYTLSSAAPPAEEAEVRAVRARLGLDGRKAVVYVGKLSLGKGGPVFLRAAERVAQTRPDTVFLIAGADRSGQSPSADVRWLGRIEHEAMPALYRAADLVVVPSVGPEALSRVPLEAAAAGRPTVGARAGGIPEEILDGETGIVVERGDPEELAKAMLRLLEDEGLRTRLGEGARRFVGQRFGADAVVESLLAAYAESGR